MTEERDATSAGLPTWVRTTLIVLGVLLVLMVVVMLAMGGNHGPGRHMGGLAPAGVPALGRG